MLPHLSFSTSTVTSSVLQVRRAGEERLSLGIAVSPPDAAPHPAAHPAQLLGGHTATPGHPGGAPAPAPHLPLATAALASSAAMASQGWEDMRLQVSTTSTLLRRVQRSRGAAAER